MIKSKYAEASLFIKQMVKKLGVKSISLSLVCQYSEIRNQSGYVVYDNKMNFSEAILTNLVKDLGFVTAHLSCRFEGEGFSRENIFFMTEKEYKTLVKELKLIKMGNNKIKVLIK